MDDSEEENLQGREDSETLQGKYYGILKTVLCKIKTLGNDCIDISK